MLFQLMGSLYFFGIFREFGLAVPSRYAKTMPRLLKVTQVIGEFRMAFILSPQPRRKLAV
jgi:hypothetical protein